MLQGLPDTVDMLLGNVTNGYGAGTIGEVCALALIAGLIWMLWRRVITWHIPITILATVFVLSGALHAANPVYAHPMAVVLRHGCRKADQEETATHDGWIEGVATQSAKGHLADADGYQCAHDNHPDYPFRPTPTAATA